MMEKARRKQTRGRLLFLQGFVSPMWLNCLGSKFEVDPEFYFRHLDFTSLFPSPHHFTRMSLPSMADIVRNHMVSILSWNGVNPLADSTAELRSSCKTQMSRYLHNLVNEQEIIPGDSVVCRFWHPTPSTHSRICSAYRLHQNLSFSRYSRTRSKWQLPTGRSKT